MTKCGDFYNSGFGTSSPSLSTAISYYSRACKLGDLDSLLNLGALFEEQKKFEQAAEMYKQAMQAGSSWGYLNLALMLRRQKKSEKEAAALLAKAAEMGNTEAKKMLGV
jgi:uncharacterized protein